MVTRDPIRLRPWLSLVLALALAACSTTGDGRRRRAAEGWRAPRYGLSRGEQAAVEPRSRQEQEPPSASTERPAEPAPPVEVVPIPLQKVRGGRLLVGAHPQVIRAALALYARAEAEGIQVVFISGYRKYQPRKRGARGGWASWHNFGLAFDLNLVRRKSMRDANAHWDADAADWRRLGEIGRSLGLEWGGDFRTPDIFHFEWHPGHDAWINPTDLQQLLSLAGPDGAQYQRTWTLFPNAP